MYNFVYFTLCCTFLLFLQGGTAIECGSIYNDGTDALLSKTFDDCVVRYSDLDWPDFESSEDDEKTSQNSSANKNSDTKDRSTDQSINGDTSNNQNNGRGRSMSHLRKKRNDFLYGDIIIGSLAYNRSVVEIGCVVQCIFDELKAVNHDGFPDIDRVISVMTQGIKNPEIKDGYKEAIIQCFDHVQLKTENECEFSLHLLLCLAKRAEEKCDDWEG